MPSNIPDSIPADGVPVAKSTLRSAFSSIRSELEHGGFFRSNVTGAVERATRDKLDEFISVRDLGAIGDGTLHTVEKWLTGKPFARGYANLAAIQLDYPHVTALTDSADWAAIQLAVDRATSNGGQVRIPKGHYVLNRTITYMTPSTATLPGLGVSAFVNGPAPRIAGDGPGHTILRWTAVDTVWPMRDNGRGYGIRLFGNPPANTRQGLMGFCIIEGLLLIGPSADPASPTIGLLVGSYSHLTLRNVHACRWGLYGFHLLRRFYRSGSHPVYSTIDDRAGYALLDHVLTNNIGTTGLVGGADPLWIDTVTHSEGFEIDHLSTISCEILGGKYGAEVWAQQFADNSSMFAGGDTTLRLYTGRGSHTSKNVTLISTRFENSPMLANVMVERVSTLTMINCAFINGAPGSPFAGGDSVPAPAVWFARDRDHNCTASIINPWIDGRNRSIDVFRFGERADNNSVVTATILDPLLTSAEAGVKFVNLVTAENMNVYVHQEGRVTKYDLQGERQIVPAERVSNGYPTEGTFNPGEIVLNNAADGSAVPGWRCARGGTIGTVEAGLRGFITSTQGVLRFTGNSLPIPFKIGDWISIAGYAAPTRVTRLPRQLSNVRATSVPDQPNQLQFNDLADLSAQHAIYLDGGSTIYRVSSINRTSRIVTLTTALAAPVTNAVVTRQTCLHVAEVAPAHLNSVAVTFAAPELVPLATGGVRTGSGASLDLAHGALLHVSQPAATTLTGIANALEGQAFTLVFADANTTIPHGDLFKLKAGGSFVSAVDRTLSLVRYGGAFYEV
jgi:hypothetical protein